MPSLSHPVQVESWYCRVQKQNIWIWRKPQLCYGKVLLINIYLQKSICNFRSYWRIQLKLEIHRICWRHSFT